MISNNRRKRVFSWLIGTALVAPLATQAQVPDVVPMPEVPVEQPPHLVIAGDETRWAAARGAKTWVGGVSQEMVDTLVNFTGDGTGVDVIAFAPGGGWTVIAGPKYFARNVAGGYFNALERLQQNDREIKAVAFNPANWSGNHGYVIVHDRGLTHENVPGELVSQLQRFLDNGDDIYDVAITEDAAWSFVASSGDWTRRVEGGYFEALTNVRETGRKAEAIAFFGGPRHWIIATTERFHGAGAPDGLASHLREKFGLEGDIRKVAVADPASKAPSRPADAIDGFRLAQKIAPISDRAGAGQIDVTREIDLVDKPIRYLSWAERGNRPCTLGVAALSPATDEDYDRERWNSGDCEHVGPGILGINTTGLRTSVPAEEVVTGMRVCTNHSRKNARVKGFELIGWNAQQYYDAGENPATSATGDAHAARANCSDWHHTQCPSGHVATGVQLTVRQAGGLRMSGRWVNGARLICRRLEPI